MEGLAWLPGVMTPWAFQGPQAPNAWTGLSARSRLFMAAAAAGGAAAAAASGVRRGTARGSAAAGSGRACAGPLSDFRCAQGDSTLHFFSLGSQAGSLSICLIFSRLLIFIDFHGDLLYCHVFLQ